MYVNVLSTPLLWLTVFSLFLITAMFHLLLSFNDIFTLTALLTACLPCSRGLGAQDLSLPLTPILSTSLMQKLISILSLSPLSLVNSGTLSLLLHFHLPMTWTVSRERYQDTYPILLATESTVDFPGTGTAVGLFVLFWLPLADSLLHKKRDIPTWRRPRGRPTLGCGKSMPPAGSHSVWERSLLGDSRGVTAMSGAIR